MIRTLNLSDVACPIADEELKENGECTVPY